jgi:thiamine biosynthesis lipoprotein
MKHLETVMGIPMSIDIRDDSDFSSAADDAFDVLSEADTRFSPFRLDSELSEINQGRRDPSAYSEHMREIFAIAEKYHRLSGGAFTIHLNGKFDTNGIVKGWAVQRAAEVLIRTGARNFCINAGGDVLVQGRSKPLAPHSGWNAGIRSPTDSNSMVAVLFLRDSAVATSGTYERGEHIIDGRTGLPARSFASVSVVAATLTVADILATTVFAIGLDGPQWAVDNFDCSVLAITSSGEFRIAGDLPLARPS